MASNFKLALRNLTRQKRRNIVLAIAIAFGFFVVTVLDGFASGAVGCFEDQITQLLGGTVLIQGLEKLPPETEDGKSKVVTIVRDRDYIKNIVENNNKIKYKSYSCYSTATGQMIFEGQKSIVQLFGRDLTDKSLLESFQFTEGGIENLTDSQVLIISDKTAESMNLAVGDPVLISAQTIYGQNNVADFTVAGIYKSNGFLNTMQCFGDLDYVNQLVEIPEGGYSTFTINLKNKNEQDLVAMLIENQIRQDNLNVTSRLEAMKLNPANIGKGIEKQLYPDEVMWEGTKYAVETFYDELPAMKQVLFYVHMITTIILIVILLIVMVGISNTYRMILYERIREIGTMRAIGMTARKTKKIFSLEAIILCLFGALMGLALALAAMGIAHLIPVTNDALVFFTQNGHFEFSVSAGSIFLQYFLLILLTYLAVKGSAKKAARMSPAQALRTVK